MNFSCFPKIQESDAGLGSLYNPYACLNHYAWDFNAFVYDGAQYYYRSFYETSWRSAGHQVTYEAPDPYYYGQEWFEEAVEDGSDEDGVQDVQGDQSWRSEGGQTDKNAVYFQEDGQMVIPHYSEIQAELEAFLSEP